MDESLAQDNGLSGAPSPALPRLRWYQFRLRTLLAVMTAIIGLLVAWRTFVEPYRQQRQTMELIGDLGGTYESEAADRWQLWLFGADYQHVIRVNLADCDQPDQYLPQIARLPRLESLVVGGLAFEDDHLNTISRLPALRLLVLDSTSVSPEALAMWQSQRPGVDVYMSQRRALAHLRNCWVRLGTRVNTAQMAAVKSLDEGYFEEADAVQEVYTLRMYVVSSKPRWFTLDDAAYLKPVITLEYLNLAGANVTDDILVSLRNLSRLEKLVLSRTQVDGTGLAHLAALAAC